MSTPTFRRYCLLKSFEAEDNGLAMLREVWRSKQRDADATELPSDFPARATLIAAYYEALEDIDGADVAELQLRARLQSATAQAVITAAAAALE